MKQPLITKILNEVWLSMKLSKNMFHFYFNEHLRSIIKDHYYEERLGIDTTEPLRLVNDTSLFKDAGKYEAMPYFELEKLTKYLQPSGEDVFVDVGCGKGRVVAWFAMQKVQKVIGVELSDELYQAAKANISKLSCCARVELLNLDAAKYDYESGTIIILCNPFGIKTLEAVADKIRASLAYHPRTVRIVYYLPVYRSVLDNQKWLEFQGIIPDTRIYVWVTTKESFSRAEAFDDNALKSLAFAGD